MYNSTFVCLKNFVLLYFWIPDSGLRIPAFRVALQCMQIWCRFAPRSIESSYFRERKKKKKKGMDVWNLMLILLPCASDGVEEGKQS